MDGMLTAGEILKRRRLEKNYSLDEVSAATKIQKHYLEALESNDFETFPSEVYTKGFLQNYAKFLEINSSKILALYRRSQGEITDKSLDNTPKLSKRPKFIITPTLILGISVGLIVIATLSYLIIQFYKFQSPPELRVEEPSGNISVETKEFIVKGKTEEGIFVTINDEAVKVDSDGTFEASIMLSEGTNTLIIKARHPDKVGKEAVITRNVEYKPRSDNSTEIENDSQETTSSEEPPAENNEIQENSRNLKEIRIRVQIGASPAWIEIETDGTLIYAAVAEPGSILEFTAEKTLSLVTGRMDSTQVKINEKDQNIFVTDQGVGVLLCDFDRSDKLNCRQP